MEQNLTEEYFEIDIKELVRAILKKIWIIILSGICIGVLAFLYSKYYVVPLYQSTTKIYVMNKENENSALTYSDIQTGTQLTMDYMTLVTSRPVTEQVISELNLPMKHEDMVNIISVSNPTNTRILNITVTYSDPIVAKLIADAVRESSAAHISRVMDIKEVNLVEEANVPELPFSPNILRNTILGVMLGCFLAVIVIVILYVLDDSIKTTDDIEKYLGLSVLSLIPTQKEMKESKKVKRKQTKSREVIQQREVIQPREVIQKQEIPAQVTPAQVIPAHEKTSRKTNATHEVNSSSNKAGHSSDTANVRNSRKGNTVSEA